MATTNFQFSFNISKQSEEAFRWLMDPNNWWVGLFGEEIRGESKNIGDEFTFRAGGGMHYSSQKLKELVPGKKITWLVTESNLSFLKKANEWTGTEICFEIEQNKGSSKITFSHAGLVPAFECYDQCSSAWTEYLQNLKKNFGQFKKND